MSSSMVPGKPLSTAPASNHSPASSQAALSGEASRQPNQSPSQSQCIPRKGQASRRQHRNQRRPGGQILARSDDDDMAEIRAVRNASSRRGQTSITHLLNLSRPQYHDILRTSYSRSYRRHPAWGHGSVHHVVDKARYVHANYRFVMSPAGDYATPSIDADKHLDWNDVLQVVASAESQQTSCPICLSEPVAPRMAMCGHIFCLACLVRFMNTNSDGGMGAGPEKKQQNRWRKCPICDNTVYLTDVRPVRFHTGQENPLPRLGDNVVLRLMARKAQSTLALPKEEGAETLCSGEGVPWHFATTVMDYARFMKGTGAYMEEQFDGEIKQLLEQEKEDELLFHEANEWTQRAVKSINAAKKKVEGLGEVEAALSSGVAAAAGSNQARHAEPDFYFYSASPHLYLSPLDIRILKTKYGSFSAFPSTLLPRVEHISTGHVVDDALRKRAKYLGHLPHGCLISFLECDWTDIVPPEILSSFHGEIENRRKRNRDKAAQEEREHVQAEKAAAAAIREARRGYDFVDEEVMVRYGGSPPSESPVIEMNDFQPLGVAGSTPPNPRPGFIHLRQNVGMTPPRTVWGTAAVPASMLEIRAPDSRAPVDDGWMKEEQYRKTLGDDELAIQIAAVDMSSGGGNRHEGALASSSTGNAHAPHTSTAEGWGERKKKKKQKITLMSTGGKRGL